MSRVCTRFCKALDSEWISINCFSSTVLVIVVVRTTIYENPGQILQVAQDSSLPNSDHAILYGIDRKEVDCIVYSLSDRGNHSGINIVDSYIELSERRLAFFRSSRNLFHPIPLEPRCDDRRKVKLTSCWFDVLRDNHFLSFSIRILLILIEIAPKHRRRIRKNRLGQIKVVLLI